MAAIVAPAQGFPATLALANATLTNGSSGLAVNLANSNTWTALQTFSAGIAGTGDTGGLTAGTGLLDTANDWTAQQAVLDLAVTGLTGATTASRYVGGTSGSAPTTGTFAVGDYVVDASSQTFWLCTAAGTPGTWAQVSPLNATTDIPGIVKVTASPVSGNPLVPSVVTSAAETALSTTSATVLGTYTPSAIGAYTVQVFYRVITAATMITLSVTYTDAGGTGQTDTLVNGVTQAVGDYWAHDVLVSSAAGITVSMTAGTADQVYTTATIEGVS